MKPPLMTYVCPHTLTKTSYKGLWYPVFLRWSMLQGMWSQKHLSLQQIQVLKLTEKLKHNIKPYKYLPSMCASSASIAKKKKKNPQHMLMNWSWKSDVVNSKSVCWKQFFNKTTDLNIDYMLQCMGIWNSRNQVPKLENSLLNAL